VKQEAFFRRFFIRKSVSIVGNNSGQAVIEYVLLLIVVVSLVLGLRGVFTSMNSFMTDMIGGYITCLMEYGELPALGVEENELKQHKDGAGKRCPVPRFVASTSFGNSTGGGSGGPGSSGSANGSGSSKSSGRNGGKSASKNGDGSDSSDGSSDSKRGGGSSSNSRSSARGRSSSSPYSRGQISRAGGFSTADNPSDLNNATKTKALEAPEEDSGSGDTSRSRRNSRRSARANAKYKALVGKMAEDLQKNVRTPRKPSSTLLAVDEGFRMTVVKRNFTPPEQKPYIEEKPEEGFQFGSFLKWIIIAGIIIACFILFGGQVMNYSNSDS
jgi:hypothetical protein